jgi:hypothetical protein
LNDADLTLPGQATDHIPVLSCFAVGLSYADTHDRNPRVPGICQNRARGDATSTTRSHTNSYGNSHTAPEHETIVRFHLPSHRDETPLPHQTLTSLKSALCFRRRVLLAEPLHRMGIPSCIRYRAPSINVGKLREATRPGTSRAAPGDCKRGLSLLGHTQREFRLKNSATVLETPTWWLKDLPAASLG